MKKVLVGLSGGVDSAVSAYLLKEAGYDVTAGFMINYLDEENPNCPTKVDLQVAKEVAEFLNVPFFTFDYRQEYSNKVLDYMFEGYKRGITPNPDVMCNKEIKFKMFLDEAMDLGFDYIATGHYARIVNSEKGIVNSGIDFVIPAKAGIFNNVQDDLIDLRVKHEDDDIDGQFTIFHLLKGVDSTKDQSYFLAFLNQYQLSKSLFPIGGLEKKEVREIAEKIGLPNAKRKDSQGICFVGKVDFKKFLEKKIKPKEGNIIDTSGKILGKHRGVYYYTIGQRKGIEIGGLKEPIFVIKKDIERNELVVGNSGDIKLYSDKLYCNNLIFISEVYDFPLKAKAKIRYRQVDQDLEIVKLGKENFEFVFEEKQRAIASGQVVAVYIGEELIASGVIN
ncbi:MAG: tRNA 2-thiouridine(34) synthase MnmA [Candidatus Gracilibacteria bacterium]|nr:tRNA 2-thiouridine(34) synthase MnmA [Candidatus Gracilibacteria bacterium]